MLRDERFSQAIHMKKLKLNFQLEQHYLWGIAITELIAFSLLYFRDLNLSQNATFIVLGILAGLACVYGRTKSVFAALLLYFTYYYYSKLTTATGLIELFRVFFETLYATMAPAFILFWTVIIVSGIVSSNFSPERSFFWTFIALITGYVIIEAIKGNIMYLLLYTLPSLVYCLLEASLAALIFSTFVALAEKLLGSLKYSQYLAVLLSLTAALIAFILIKDYLLAGIVSAPALLNAVFCARRKSK